MNVVEVMVENIIISLRRFIKGGAAPFASVANAHHKAIGGPVDMDALFKNRLRECEFSYSEFVK